MPGTENPIAWFEEWFNHPLYLEVYSHRDQDEAERCIRTILSVSDLEYKPRQSVSVLDIACGAGRHALELARLGYCVTGNDLSPFLLEEAKKEAAKCRIDLSLTCCDMRSIAACAEYDLVVQLFTSFGYFSSRDDDMLVLRKVHAALKSKGRYVLDLINLHHLERTLVARSTRIAGELTVDEARRLEDGRVIKTIAISSPTGETLNFTESVRVYERDEIVSMVLEAGFTLTSIAGDYNGGDYDEESSPRMMLFCRKN